MSQRTFDVFISHASEDKHAVAIPLARALERLNLAVWLDAQELHLGDQLRAKINEGLLHSKFGVVVLSAAFFRKDWPQDELDAMLGRETRDQKIVLPIRHGLSAADVKALHPTLANKLSISTDDGVDVVAEQVARAIAATQYQPRNTTVAVDPASARAKAAIILSTLADLEQRATTCLTRSIELRNATISELSDPIIAANIASHQEFGTIDTAIAAYATSVMGRPPTADQWMSHWDRLMYLERNGRDPKTAQAGFKNQLEWIRLSRMFVRSLGEA